MFEEAGVRVNFRVSGPRFQRRGSREEGIIFLFQLAANNALISTGPSAREVNRYGR